LRVTPGVEAHTHEYIATGADDSKFGLTVSTGAAREAALHAIKSRAMHLVGFHCHIGSQIFALESYVLAAEVVARLAAEVRDASGHLVEELNLGGGLAVPYTAEDLDAPSIAEFGTALRDGFALACGAAGLDPAPRLCVEAGRSIAAPSGLTLYTVGTIKGIRRPSGLGGEGGGLGGEGGVHTYVAVDGGMGDNPRVALYSAAYEAFLPARAGDERPFVATVAGRHCEQGDLLVSDAQLPEGVALGDVLATPVTGAYGHSMASTYNQMPRPAVVFVRDGRARVVVRRETFDDLVARDEDEGRHEGD
jgi:diaminopimelate decarboxylase